MSAKKTISVKVVIIGEPAVGKTTLRINFIGQGMEGDYLMTLGVDMAQAEIEISNELSLDAQIWDIAGQDSLEQITNQFLAGTQGAIFVFDLTRDYTFDKINSWLDRLHMENPELENNIPFIIVGNKSDLEAHIKMSDSTVTEYLEYINRHHVYSTTPTEYVKTSAKTGDKVKEAFVRLGETIIRNFQELDGEQPEVDIEKLAQLEETLVEAKTVEQAKPEEPFVRKPVGLPTGPPPRAPEPIVETPVVEEIKVEEPVKMPSAPPPAPEPIVETPVVEEVKVEEPVKMPSAPPPPAPKLIVETPVVEEVKVEEPVKMPSAPPPPAPELIVETPVAEEVKVEEPMKMPSAPPPPAPELIVETPVAEEVKVEEPVKMPSAPPPAPELIVETPVAEEVKVEEPVKMPSATPPALESIVETQELPTKSKTDEIDDLVKEIMDETKSVKKKKRFGFFRRK